MPTLRSDRHSHLSRAYGRLRLVSRSRRPHAHDLVKIGTETICLDLPASADNQGINSHGFAGPVMLAISRHEQFSVFHIDPASSWRLPLVLHRGSSVLALAKPEHLANRSGDLRMTNPRKAAPIPSSADVGPHATMPRRPSTPPRTTVGGHAQARGRI